MTQKIIQRLKKVKQLRYIAKLIRNTPEFFLQFLKRNPNFFFYSPKVAFAKASRKYSIPDKSQIKITEIENNSVQGLSLYRDVISYPLTQGKEKDYLGGLINTKTNTLIDEAIHFGYMKVFCQEPPNLKSSELTSTNIPEIEHTVLFGGIFYNNFGHFLLESLGRLWAYEYVKELDPYMLFYAPWVPPQDYLEKQNYAYQVLSGFNIPLKRVFFVDHIAKIKKIIIPSQKYGYEYCKNPDSIFLKFVNSFKFPQIIPKGFENADKIYVSRSKIPAGAGKPIGEKFFEEYLLSNGYKIFHPERYSLYQQLSLYSKAKKLIFCDGGALHACILLPKLEAEVAVIARRRDTQYDCREILEQFQGYNKNVLWIDAVKEQYQFGLATWDAVSVVDWFQVSVQLQAYSFVKEVFESFNNVDHRNLIRSELRTHLQSISGDPRFTDFMMKMPE